MNMVHSGEAGFAPKGLERLSAAIENGITQEQYDGAVVVVARDGKVHSTGHLDLPIGRAAAPLVPRMCSACSR
jgi:hypothetical protein